MSRIKSAQESFIEQKASLGIFPRGKTAIVLIYTLLGPAIGGMLTVSVLIAVWAVTEFGMSDDLFERPLETLLSLPLMFLIGALYGYIIGGAQAFACALLLAAVSDLNGRFSYARAAIASMIVAFLSAVFFYVAIDDNLGNAAFMVAAGPPTSLILRFLFRKRFAPVRAL